MSSNLNVSVISASVSVLLLIILVINHLFLLIPVFETLYCILLSVNVIYFSVLILFFFFSFKSINSSFLVNIYFSENQGLILRLIMALWSMVCLYSKGDYRELKYSYSSLGKEEWFWLNAWYIHQGLLTFATLTVQNFQFFQEYVTSESTVIFKSSLFAGAGFFQDSSHLALSMWTFVVKDPRGSLCRFL